VEVFYFGLMCGLVTIHRVVFPRFYVVSLRKDNLFKIWVLGDGGVKMEATYS
jgi:hypothetical protein